jgi:cytochrome c peroxidase
LLLTRELTRELTMEVIDSPARSRLILLAVMRAGAFGSIEVRALGALLLVAGCGRWADDLVCADLGCGWKPLEWQRLSSLTGLGPLPADPSNRWADDPGAAALGQSFYFDGSFSGPSRQIDSLRRPTPLQRAVLDQPANVSCATCHELTRSGTDISSLPGHVSVGAGVTDVNAPPTINAARRRTLFWNGRMESLWGLHGLVGEADTTMNGTRLQTAHILATRYGAEVQAVFGDLLDPDWRARIATFPAQGKPGRVEGCQPGDPDEPAQDAFDCLPPADRDLATAMLVIWAKALAAFGRRLESRDSPFDRFVAAGPGSLHISESARRGARLFVGKASCIDCHSGPLFTDEDFHNLGVPQTGTAVPTLADCVAGSVCDCVAGRGCLPWGRFYGISWQNDPTVSWPALVARYRDDAGPRVRRAPPALDERLKGAWRTPSLRDVALTAPYMHDGAYRTLEEVIWHYNTAGGAVGGFAVGTPSVKLKPLGLDAAEVSDLAAFLQTLTGAPPPPALLDARPMPSSQEDRQVPAR